MNIGIDIDDTITKRPELYRQIMEEWIISGYQIFIITGNKLNDMPRAIRLRQLKNLGITPNHYTELCIASATSDNLISYRKGVIAYQKKLDLFIDNEPKNCSEVNRRLKNCVCWCAI